MVTTGNNDYDAPEINPPTTAMGRVAQGFLYWVERRIRHGSKVGTPAFFDTAQFPWVARIEAAWPEIRRELDAVMVHRERLPAFHEITSEVTAITSDQDWKTYMLLGYGVPIAANLARCPHTARALQQIPGVKTAFFSILSPGKRIPPHAGPYNGVLRLHLGLLVPEPAERCWIKVDRETRHWREGEVMLFDDAYVHEVHNDTEGYRVVLFVDFERPCRWPVNWLNRLILRAAMFTPLIQEAQRNQSRWEKLFYGKQGKA